MFSDIDVCGEVRPYDFVRSCATEGDVRQLPEQRRKELRLAYGHMNICRDCRGRMQDALGEFSLGSSEFDRELFSRNTEHLRDML